MSQYNSVESALKMALIFFYFQDNSKSARGMISFLLDICFFFYNNTTHSERDKTVPVNSQCAVKKHSNLNHFTFRWYWGKNKILRGEADVFWSICHFHVLMRKRHIQNCLFENKEALSNCFIQYVNRYRHQCRLRITVER